MSGEQINWLVLIYGWVLRLKLLKTDVSLIQGQSCTSTKRQSIGLYVDCCSEKSWLQFDIATNVSKLPKKELKSLIRKPTFVLNFESSVFQGSVNILPTSGWVDSRSTDYWLTNPIYFIKL